MIMANRARQVTRHGGVLWIFNNHAILVGRPLTSCCSLIFFSTNRINSRCLYGVFLYDDVNCVCNFFETCIECDFCGIHNFICSHLILLVLCRFFSLLLLPLVERLNEVVDRHAAACNQTQLDLTCVVRVCGQVVIKFIVGNKPTNYWIITNFIFKLNFSPPLMNLIKNPIFLYLPNLESFKNFYRRTDRREGRKRNPIFF